MPQPFSPEIEAILDSFWDSVGKFCKYCDAYRINASLMMEEEQDSDELKQLRADVVGYYDSCLAQPELEFMITMSSQLAPAGIDTVGDKDMFIALVRHFARGAFRLPGFTEDVELYGRKSCGKEYVITCLDGLFGTSLDSPTGYIQFLENCGLCQSTQKGGIAAFESQLEGARFAKVSEASVAPLNVAVYKAMCEGGSEIAAKAGYECRRTDKLTVQNRALLITTSNTRLTLPHSTSQEDKDAVADRANPFGYELSFTSRVIDQTSERPANNIYKLRAENGVYSQELWAHLVRARATIPAVGIARFLTPQPPKLLAAKLELKDSLTPAESILTWIRQNTINRGESVNCTPWKIILQLLSSEQMAATEAIKNVTKVLTSGGYKTSGTDQPRVRHAGIQGPALTHNLIVLNLTPPALERYRGLFEVPALAEAAPAVAEFVAAPTEADAVIEVDVAPRMPDVHSEATELITFYAGRNGFNLNVQKMAQESFGYSVQSDGFRDGVGLVYQLLASGYDVRSKLAIVYP